MINTIEIFSRNPEETQQFGELLGEKAKPGDVYLLTGKLGAGKTCLTQGIARGLGIREYVASPTFVIMREMHGRLNLYHIDLYRLDHIEEIADVGLDDYFYGQGLCVIEWAEKGLSVLPEENLQIQIDYFGNMKRNIHITYTGERYENIMSTIINIYKGAAKY